MSYKNTFQTVFLLFTFLVLSACSSGVTKPSGSSATDVPPSRFDNPIIKYDTEDPTHKVGEIIYTADPAVMVVDDTVYLYTTQHEQPWEGTE